MKKAIYFSLLCGLLSSTVWGQALPKHQSPVVLRCSGLACTASSPAVIRTVKLGNFRTVTQEPLVMRAANNQVKLGTFKSFSEKAAPAKHVQIALLQNETRGQ